jgi:hypothetical protein
MTDHDTLARSLIFTNLADSMWPGKGFKVVAPKPMPLGNIGFQRLWANQGSSIHHGHDR